MAKESPYPPVPKPIFRECFLSDGEVRRNGGVPVGITYNNGVSIHTGIVGANMYYSGCQLNNTISIRIRFKSYTKDVSFRALWDFRNLAGVGSGYVYINANTYTIVTTSGTIYVNGIVSSTILATPCDVVITGHTVNGALRIGSAYIPSNPIIAEIDLFEIYQGTLTANEVANLYSNSRYKQLSPHGEVLGSEEMIGGDFSSSSGWTIPTGWDISGGTANYLDTNNAVNIYRDDFTLTASTLYKLSFTISGATSARIYILNYDGSSPYSPINLTLTNGTYNHLFISSAVLKERKGISIWGYTAGSSYSVDNISLKKYYTGATPILDVNCANGVIKNTANTTAITITSVPVVKGATYKMSFNGSSSKIDCSTYNTLVSDISLVCWFKAYTLGESNIGRIIDNGQFIIACNASTNRFSCTSNNSTTIYSSNNSIVLGKWICLVVLRKSDGKVSFYIDGALSGSADQASGTPVAGSNIIIGNNTGATATWYGLLDGVKVYSGIISTNEISEIATSEKLRNL